MSRTKRKTERKTCPVTIAVKERTKQQRGKKRRATTSETKEKKLSIVAYK